MNDTFEADGDGLLTQAFADVDGELCVKEDDGSGVSEAILSPLVGVRSSHFYVMTVC